MNWISTLENLIEYPEVTEEEVRNLTSLAAAWPTCACGELCKALPRNQYTDAPEDFTLYRLGCHFSSLIRLQEWKAAVGVFHHIEARTFELLKGG